MLRVIQKNTPHPCAGMTPAQRRDFELVAINQRPRGGRLTIKALEKRGLIVETEPEVVGHDRLGKITIRQWYVPLAVHMQWCKWAEEHEALCIHKGPDHG